MNTSISLARETAIQIPVASGMLHGDLVEPVAPVGLVIFAHGSGSSRNSPRNQAVARTLHRERLATLLFDLLSAREEQEELAGGMRRFDVPMLAQRLLEVTRVVRGHESMRPLPCGYFGSSTGAAAALMAAARLPGIRAVVSRGGRTDLADAEAARVTAPTLLIVGGLDGPVIEFNRRTLALLAGPRELAVIPHASHLFPEPGALDEVAALAASWFSRHFADRPGATPPPP